MNKSILLTFVILASIIGCNTPKKQYKHIALHVVLDKTHTHTNIPSIAQVKRICQFKNNIDATYTISFSFISALQFNPSYHFQLENDSVTQILNSNNIPKYREARVKQFVQKLADTLSFITKETISYDNTKSNCFVAIAKTLNEIAMQKATTKAVFVYSDLVEHSSILDAYHTNLSIAEIENLFEKQKLLPISLHGITLYFFYQPTTQKEDTLYAKMFTVYKQLIEKRGGVVVQQTN
jgi:hypothetical protein